MKCSNCFQLLWISLLCLYSNITNSQYAFTLNTEGYETGIDIVNDNEGNTFVVGVFTGTIDIDPSSNVFELTSNSNEYQDIFIASYDSDRNLRFAFNIGWEGQFDDWAQGLTVDNEGNIYVTGQFNGVVDFDPFK